MFVISMSFLQMPYALLMGIIIAITALIPVFGAFIGCFIGIIMIGIVNPIQAVAFIILFLILQQIEGNFIYPHVVGIQWDFLLSGSLSLLLSVVI